MARDAAACSCLFERVVSQMRQDRRPVIVVLSVDRLDNHTNADDQRVYRSGQQIEQARAAGDPLAALQRRLSDYEQELTAIRADVDRQMTAAEETALAASDPMPESQVKAIIPVELTHPVYEHRGDPQQASLTMKDALRQALEDHLQHDPRVMLLGQDIEDPKGDVFGVTRGLSTQFPGRVENAPLAEATIVGVSIGRALAGQRPVAFIQFADFLGLAYNQLANELASLHWRSDGQWTAPMIVMAPIGGYRPGLGPFHSQSGESVFAHAPGLDVLIPATAGDAAGMLNAAFASQRPTLFLYPKALLNDSSLATSSDIDQHLTPLGVARKVRAGNDITLVGWGNTVRLCERAAAALETANVEAEVLDLRSISPWDRRAVLASAEKTARLVVVQEDIGTCGFASEVLAHVAEHSRVPVAMRRVVRDDVLLPCHFSSQLEVLPTFRRTLETAADLLRLDVQWLKPPTDEPRSRRDRSDRIGSFRRTRRGGRFASPSRSAGEARRCGGLPGSDQERL